MAAEKFDEEDEGCINCGEIYYSPSSVQGLCEPCKVEVTECAGQLAFDYSSSSS